MMRLFDDEPDVKTIKSEQVGLNEYNKYEQSCGWN